MDVMKRNLLLALVLSAFVAAPALAVTTIEETTETEYLINSGYSELMAEDIFMEKNRVNGKPIEPLYEKKHGFWAKLYNGVCGYFDPSIDTVDRLHHDVHPSPTFTDL